jgi:multiple sugar transport system substrate-binding protein
MNRRRWLVSAVMMAVCAGLVFGTGSQESPAAKGTAVEPVTLTLWRAGSDALETQYWEGAIKIYQDKHPNVTVKLTSIPWGNDMETKLNTAYVGGTFPDVVSYSIASIAGHAEAGQYAPLDAYVAKWNGKSDVLERILNLGEYKGHTYGVGFIPDPRVFVWRKDYFAGAGLDPEKPPKTWEDLQGYAVKLTKIENGITTRGGFSIRKEVNNGDAAQDWQTFALQNGSPIIDVPNNKPLFNNPKGVEAADFLAGMYRKGVSPQVAMGEDAFALSRVAMAFANPSSVKSLTNNNPNLKDQVGYAGPMQREKKATFAGLRLIFMGSTTKHTSDAWNFMEFVLSKDESWRRYQVLRAPIVLKSLKDDFIKDNPTVNSAVFEGIEYGQGYPIVTYSFSFMELISRALQSAYFGQSSAKDAFADAEKEFYKQLPAWLNK